MRKMLFNLFDYRSVYLIRDKKKVKIGISTNTKRRLREIESSQNSSGLKILASVSLFYARKIEKRLHSKYQARRVLHHGAGKTEYFKLTFFQVIAIKLKLRFIQFLQMISILFILSIIIIISCSTIIYLNTIY